MKYFIDSNMFIYAAAGKPEAVDMLSEAIAGLWSGYSIITRIEVFGYKNLGWFILMGKKVDTYWHRENAHVR